MAKTQGSIIELIDKNLRAWRSHFSSREKVSFIYAKIRESETRSQTGLHVSSVRIAVPISVHKRPYENLVEKHPKH